METERFEALIDAILAIIITLIVLEFNLPNSPSFTALFELKTEFFEYFISFFVIYNIWNSHHNLFIRINKLTDSVVWVSLIQIFILSFLPYVTIMVSNNFYSFFAQACFGSIFVLLHIHYIIQTLILEHSDPANIALKVYLDKGARNSCFEFILFAIVYIIGYLYYHPTIMFGCLIAMIFWLISDQYLSI